ncbi:MAG: exodeoxyribonuclease III [Deltaproteobacteria bacterium]|nr:exodeoxyribonuclease III [Deltaproteobacteria bacterium]
MQKIITWNVNSIGQRLARLLALLDRWAPDVVCLQELKCIDENFPLAAIEAAGYHAVFHGQKAFNGVALLSRELPLEAIKGLNDNVDDPQARFISARFGELTVASVYVPNGQTVGSEKYFYKLNWLERLRQHLAAHYNPEDSVIVAGDFNIAPAPMDTHDPAVWEGQILCSERERAALAATLDLGFIDSFRDLNPGVTQFTWWDYRMLGFQKNLGLRIDLLLASAGIKTRLRRCYVDRDERKGEKPSDHAPVILELA